MGTTRCARVPARWICGNREGRFRDEVKAAHEQMDLSVYGLDPQLPIGCLA